MRTLTARQYLDPLLDQGFVSASLFLASFALARYTSAAEFGPFAVAKSIVVLLGILQGALVTRPLCVIANVMPAEQRGRYVASSGSLQVWIMAVSLPLAGSWALVAIPVASPTLVVALLFFLLTYQLREFHRFRTIANLAPRRAAARSAVYFVVVVTGVSAAAFGAEMSPTSILTVLGLGGLGAVLADLRHLRRPSGRAWRFALRRNFGYSKWELLGSLGNFAYIGFIPILLAATDQVAEAGGYSAAWTLGGPIQIVIFGVYNTLVPKTASIAASNVTEALRHVRRVGIGLLGLTLIAVAPLVVGAERVLAAVYNPDYVRFVDTVQLAGAYFVVFALSALFHSVLLALEDPRGKGVSQLAGMLAGVMLVSLWWQSMDARAGALATLTAETVVAAVAGALVWRRVQLARTSSTSGEGRTGVR